MRRITFTAGVGLASLIFVASCHRKIAPVQSHVATGDQSSLVAPNSEEVLILGSALTKLSASAESAVRYKNPPPNLSESDLLGFATQHDPSLLEPFSKYRLRIMSQEGHAVVLVCTKDGRAAFLEDAGCSGPLEKRAAEGSPLPPCEFSVNVREACALK